jgi:hypothetical protein
VESFSVASFCVGQADAPSSWPPNQLAVGAGSGGFGSKKSAALLVASPLSFSATGCSGSTTLLSGSALSGSAWSSLGASSA